ncbi:TetR/AcrR family transcriptional regulator [Cellulomonas sp. McL0617]|uniref:TetR/AcrR family transcriptional regulator n=1 Tax=Cellulomonas sp. McL0617 TaxID=3415675 RepID=UPI003CE9EC04
MTSRREEVLDVAVAMLEDRGPDALTMRALAARMGIRAPSLYKHVRDKDDIVAGIQERALVDLTEHLSAVSGQGLEALAHAYRSWARAHPRLYEVATRRPLARERIAPGVEQAAAAPLVAAAGGDEHAARVLWGLAHGLVDLELSDRFPPGADLDLTWQTALARWDRRPAPEPSADPSQEV